ncbi:NADH dehydrogenase 1 alpha subcomplex subunit 9, mitochondrial [Nephila pilipes]|uniref:NADH dehydrogenase [ubiquinone] 1 alpha subcomplex subunit 9, mitochondrial n=1 Tax=Nephila pilipes TaxID=299642 RepID=A0A8X6N8T6_NEPPI|nr:NADH dehydrogenase 1 alpha subcomplex subunit 9, mitochondrial [Nephila pilipes]
MSSVMFRLQKSSSPIQIIFLRQLPVRFASSDVIETDSKKFPKVKTDIHSLRRGTGGRSSFSGKIATVFGATGLLGRAVVNQLDVHVTSARNIARIAREAGVETLIHVSALNACEKPKPIILKKGSQFYASKWRGEQAVKEEFPNAIIFRPSDMWGQQDEFINYYMGQIRRTWRMMSLWNRGIGIIKQPVYYSDVAKGILKAMLDPAAAGHTFQAVGPHRYELSELMDWFHRITMRTQERYYYRVDIRFDLTFWARLILCEMILTRYRQLSWERLERVCIL